MSGNSAFVRVQGLTKRYRERVVVNAINFEIAEGEIVSLLGPSGSGKTTILRMIAGLITPDAGSIFLGNEPIFSESRNVPVERRGLGMVFQDFALWPHMNVENNIAFALKLQYLPRHEIRDRVQAMLELVDLRGLNRQYPYQLSGGQQQRIALARALATHPRLLLLDEPLSSLDTGLREMMREEIVHIVKHTNITVINVTHDQDEAMSISSHIVLLQNGSKQQSGSPPELYGMPHTTFVAKFMGKVNTLIGTVTAIEEELVKIQIGPQAFTGRLNVAAPVKIGEIAALICRPQDIVVHETPPVNLTNCFAGAITSSIFLSGHWNSKAMLTIGEEILISGSRHISSTNACQIEFPVQASLVIAVDALTLREAEANNAILVNSAAISVGAVG